jgi:hypothetical protein
MTATQYRQKINKILSTMFYLVDKVKLLNRGIVSEYLTIAWGIATVITKSINAEPGTDFLRAKFEPWVTAEELKLKNNLEDLRYCIDCSENVSLVVGPGSIETVSWVARRSFRSVTNPYFTVPFSSSLSCLETSFGHHQCLSDTRHRQREIVGCYENFVEYSTRCLVSCGIRAK